MTCDGCFDYLYFGLPTGVIIEPITVNYSQNEEGFNVYTITDDLVVTWDWNQIKSKNLPPNQFGFPGSFEGIFVVNYLFPQDPPVGTLIRWPQSSCTIYSGGRELPPSLVEQIDSPYGPAVSIIEGGLAVAVVAAGNCSVDLEYGVGAYFPQNPTDSRDFPSFANPYYYTGSLLHQHGGVHPRSDCPEAGNPSSGGLPYPSWSTGMFPQVPNLPPTIAGQTFTCYVTN